MRFLPSRLACFDASLLAKKRILFACSSDSPRPRTARGRNMLRNATRVILLSAGLAFPASPVDAHDSWINKGGYRNAAGEWCCGENDCESPEQIASTGLGWVVNGIEFVPFNEASPSPDGKLWICRRPDKTRRCVFGPPPNS